MKKIFALLLIIVLVLCGCRTEEPQIPDTDRPMLCIDGIYYINPKMPIAELPAGYEYAGTISPEMAYNTGLEGIEYYTNPNMRDFFTYQETGTPIGDNTVDTEKLAMHYVQWLPLVNE